MFVSCHFYLNKSCKEAVIGGFRNVLFVAHVERWMSKDTAMQVTLNAAINASRRL